MSGLSDEEHTHKKKKNSKKKINGLIETSAKLVDSSGLKIDNDIFSYSFLFPPSAMNIYIE